MSIILQRAHGVNGASFAAPTTPGSTIIIAVAWANNNLQIWTDGLHPLGDYANAGNDYSAAGNVVDTLHPLQAILASAFATHSCQTFTFATDPNWATSLPVYVWIFECIPLQYTLRPGEPFSQNNGAIDPAAANNFSTLPHAPVSPLQPDHSGDPNLMQGTSGRVNLYLAVEVATVAQSAVASPWTLDTVQGGFSVAYYEDLAGAAPSLQAVWNTSALSYDSICLLYSGLTPLTAGNIVIQKVTVPSGSAQSFTFNPSWGASFNLVDGETHDSGSLAPGTYSITEDPVDGWTAAYSSDASAIVVVAGVTTTVTVTNTFAAKMFTLNPLQSFDDIAPSATAINSTYCTYGFVNSTKATQNPLLGFHRKRFSEIQLNISGSGQETTTLFPNYILKNDLSFNPFAYTVPPIVLQTDPPDDIVRPVNSVGNRVYVMFSTDAVGARFSLSKTILVGIIDSYNTVNPNAG